MGKPARFTQSDVERAFSGAAKAGVVVAVILQPDGSMAIVPADRMSLNITANDLDARLAKFGSK